MLACRPLNLGVKFVTIGEKEFLIDLEEKMNFSFLIIIAVMVGLTWFMQRGQKKQVAQRQNLLDAMKAGDEVITIGGLHGLLHELDTEAATVTLDCEGVYLVFDRAAVKTVKPAAAIAEKTEESQDTAVISEE
jgi:preprotein translocase subunit YajC